jgi:hypothetical protein
MDEIKSLGAQAAKLIESVGKVKFPIIMILLAAVFAIFSLIYNDRYIVYGFATFVFGLLDYGLASVINRINEIDCGKNYRKLNLAYSVMEFIAILAYIYVLMLIVFYDFNLQF